MAKQKQFNEGHVVWLNFKKTPEQLRPIKMFHRVADFLAMMEADRQGGARKVDENFKMKSIKVNDQVVGFPRNCSWHWTAAAATLYSDGVSQMAVSFAESQ